MDPTVDFPSSGNSFNRSPLWIFRCRRAGMDGAGGHPLEISRRKSGRNLRRGKTRKDFPEKGLHVLLISNKKAREVVLWKTQRKAPPQVRSKPWRPPVPPLPSRIPSQVNPYIHSCFGSLALSPGPSSLAATKHARRLACDRRPSSSCLSETTARITQSGKANRNSRCCCCCVVVVVFRKMTSPMPSWFSNFSCPQ